METMSVGTMSLVFEYDMPNLKTDDGKVVPDSTAKFVLLALADHANDEGEGAYPGVKRICKKTSMSTQTVCNALNALRHNGYTTFIGKSKLDTNNYTINLSKLQPLGFQPLESGDSNGKNPAIPSNGLKPSITQKAKTNGDKSPRANTIPEVVLFREVTKRYPNSVNFEDVAVSVSKVKARLGRDVSKDDLLPFYKAWTSKGYNPSAITWLEWAETGIVPVNGTWKSQRPTEPKAFDAIRKFMARGENG
jgi:hypothetical protein